jgi:hypothetical protein
MSIINDGTGTGNRAKVSGNRLFAHTITEGEQLHAAESGDAYNINTGTIGLTNSTASGVLYLANNEDRDIIIEALAVGVGSAGTVTDVSTVTVIRNPTSVSFSTAVDMNQNRNFGSSKTLTADAFKGAQGATVTGGDSIVQFYTGAGTRLYAPIDLIIPKGNSVAVTIDTNTTSGTSNVYAALICYLKETDYLD